jgi:hypothetical protein
VRSTTLPRTEVSTREASDPPNGPDICQRWTAKLDTSRGTNAEKPTSGRGQTATSAGDWAKSDLQNGIARMRIIALLFAFALAGCTGKRLNADTKPICAPPMAAAFAATVMAATTIYAIGEAWLPRSYRR